MRCAGSLPPTTGSPGWRSSAGWLVIYLIAFVAAARQFRPLLGERGLLPIPAYTARVPFRRAPSLFSLHYSDRFFAATAWAGAALAAALAGGLGNLVPLWASMLLWAAPWALQVSLVNVGQTWYGFGWETLLAESGFLAIFMGNARTAPPVLLLWLVRWLIFRLEFGAGLIKMRGDRCWRDLTCLRYHHETQPMPGPLSWFFHHLPDPLHRAEALANHIAQLIVPFALFAPQPAASVAAAVIIATQLWLVLSGNFAWLNWLTIVLAASVVGRRRGGAGPAAAGRPPLRGAARLVRGCGAGGDRPGAGAQLPARPQPAVAGAAHELQLRSAAPGQHLRRLRRHHPAARRGDHRGDQRHADHARRRSGASISSRASPVIRGACRGRWRPITCGWTG